MKKILSLLSFLFALVSFSCGNTTNVLIKVKEQTHKQQKHQQQKHKQQKHQQEKHQQEKHQQDTTKEKSKT